MLSTTLKYMLCLHSEFFGDRLPLFGLCDLVGSSQVWDCLNLGNQGKTHKGKNRTMWRLKRSRYLLSITGIRTSMHWNGNGHRHYWEQSTKRTWYFQKFSNFSRKTILSRTPASISFSFCTLGVNSNVEAFIANGGLKDWNKFIRIGSFIGLLRTSGGIILTTPYFSASGLILATYLENEYCFCRLKVTQKRTQLDQQILLAMAYKLERNQGAWNRNKIYPSVPFITTPQHETLWLHLKQKTRKVYNWRPAQRAEQ